MVTQSTTESQREQQREIYLLLHNIRSTHNVGAIFRTADAVGVKKIYVSGYTPTPVDRFGRVRQDISKASLGAEKTVDWESIIDPEDLLKRLKVKKTLICAIEQNKNSINYKNIPKKDSTLFILGNEVDGIEKDLLKLSDCIAEIPMCGSKESLNVSVAAGIVLYGYLY